MKIFFGDSTGRNNVPCDSPVPAPLDVSLAIFRDLKPGTGFLGIILNDRFTLQLVSRKIGSVRIELLDTTIPAFDACDSNSTFAESLIQAAADGRDVFALARIGEQEWEHLDMSQ